MNMNVQNVASSLKLIGEYQILITRQSVQRVETGIHAEFSRHFPVAFIQSSPVGRVVQPEAYLGEAVRFT